MIDIVVNHSSLLGDILSHADSSIGYSPLLNQILTSDKTRFAFGLDFALFFGFTGGALSGLGISRIIDRRRHGYWVLLIGIILAIPGWLFGEWFGSTVFYDWWLS